MYFDFEVDLSEESTMCKVNAMQMCADDGISIKDLAISNGELDLHVEQTRLIFININTTQKEKQTRRPDMMVPAARPDGTITRASYHHMAHHCANCLRAISLRQRRRSHYYNDSRGDVTTPEGQRRYGT